MNWKNILKAQRSLIDFGLEPKSTNLAGMQRDEAMTQEIAQMRNKLQQNVGRMKTQINQKSLEELKNGWEEEKKNNHSLFTDLLLIKN